MRRNRLAATSRDPCQSCNAWRGLQSEDQLGNPSGIASGGFSDTRLRGVQANGSSESGGLIAWI
jgi:hypothetical protein